MDPQLLWLFMESSSQNLREGKVDLYSAGPPPRFSVVIATMNRCQYLLETIASIKAQTFPAHEIIVVIDGGIDDSAQVVRTTYPDVIVFEQPNLGRAVACNSGIALATGDWVCFVDDDDLWHRDKLAVTARHIAENPETRAIRNPVWFFTDSPDGPTSGFGFDRDFVASNLHDCHRAVEAGDPSHNETDYLQIEGNSFRLLLERNRGVMSASVIHRQTLIRAGCFCPMQSYTDDWTLFLNVARLCEWHTLPQRLGFTRLHTTQSTGDVDNGLIILAGKVTAWYSGRPFPHRTKGTEALAELNTYGVVYRQIVQHCFWSALRERRFGLALLVRRLGHLLLPRTRDWLYVHIPPPITWRWARYLQRTGRRSLVAPSREGRPAVNQRERTPATPGQPA